MAHLLGMFVQWEASEVRKNWLKRKRRLQKLRKERKRTEDNIIIKKIQYIFILTC